MSDEVVCRDGKLVADGSECPECKERFATPTPPAWDAAKALELADVIAALPKSTLFERDAADRLRAAVAETASLEGAGVHYRSTITGLQAEVERLTHLVTPAPKGMGMHVQCTWCAPSQVRADRLAADLAEARAECVRVRDLYTRARDTHFTLREQLEPVWTERWRRLADVETDLAAARKDLERALQENAKADGRCFCKLQKLIADLAAEREKCNDWRKSEARCVAMYNKLDDELRLARAVVEAARAAYTWCSDPWPGPPLKRCGECESCKLGDALSAYDQHTAANRDGEGS